MPRPPCRYCATIRRFDGRYPVEEARHALPSSHPRCDLHWRFTCAVCGNARHFHAVAFCPWNRKLYCMDCAPEHRAPRAVLWSWSYYYRLKCPWCRRFHPALDRAEYEHRHPWQRRRAWAAAKWGMSTSESLPERWTASIGPLEAVTEADTEQGWDRAAAWWVARYTDRGDINREWIVDPVLLRFLGPVRGQRVLDAGCGNGYLARILARRGARVNGFDQSSNLLAAAQADEAKLPIGIRYTQGNLARLPYGDETFDAAVSNIVIQDVRRYREALRETYRVLKPGGRLALSTTHPAFEAPWPARWVREPRDSERIEDRRFLRVDRYFDRVAVYWSPPGLAPVPGFHRPLRDYAAALADAGFLIARIEEPTPSPEALKRHYRAFADLLRIPIFLVVLAVKPRRGGSTGFSAGASRGGLRPPRRRPRRRPR